MAAVRAPGPSPPASARTETCPYLGLVPFSGDDARYFFGREGDCEIIAANLVASRLTILYAPSGVGKTSVLRAGVAHELEGLHDEGRPEFLVAVVRRWAVDPIGEIDLAVEDAGRRAGLTSPGRQPRLVDRLRAWSDASGATLLLIFDQFEEFLLYHHEAWEPGEPAHEVAAALSARDLEANFLLSMREDALAKLDRFKGRVPHLFENYLRLDRLDGEGGRAAIEGPITAWNEAHEDDPMQVDPGLVAALLDELDSVRVAQGRGGGAEIVTRRRADIEAPYLQLMMTRLWELERARGSPRLTAETLAAVGTVSEIVRAHVDGHMGRISRRQRDVAAAVFHQLVTPSGAKVARSLDDLAAYTKLPRERIQALLTTLSQSDWLIVRAVAADESGVAVYEIYHDVLAEAVLEWRARHEERRRIRKIARIAIAVAVVLAAIAIAALVLAAYVDEKADRATAAQRTAEDAQREASAAREEALARLELGQDPDKAIKYALAATEGARSDTAQVTLRQVLARDGVATSISTPRTEEVRDFEVSPPGTHLATVAKDGSARVWELGSSAPPAELKGDGRNVAFDRSGERVAVAGKQVTVWSVNGQPKDDLIGGPRNPVSVAWSPDGRRLAAGGDGQAKVWSSLRRSPRTLDTARGTVDRIVWSPGGRRIATVVGGRVQVWTREGKPLATVPRRGKVVSVAFSPDGKRVLVARADGAVDVLGASGNHRRCADKRAMKVTAAVFTDDGRYLISGQNVPGDTRAPEVRRLELTRECPTRLIALPEGVRITSVVAGVGGRVIYVAADDRSVRVWDADRNAQLATLPGLGHNTQLVARRSAEDGSDVLLSASVNGTIRLWRPGVVPLARFDVKASVRAVAFDTTGRRVLAATRGGVRSSRLGGGPSMALHGPALGRRSVLGGDGTLLAVGSKSAVRIREVDGGRSLRLPAPAVTSLNFSPDGTRLLTMHDDGIARIWRTDRAAGALHELKAATGRGRPYAFFTEDGTRAIVVHGELREYDASSADLISTSRGTGGTPEDSGFGEPPAAAGVGRLVFALRKALPSFGTDIGHRSELRGAGTVMAMAFSPDASVIATAGLDGLRLWDAARGDPLMTLASGRFDTVAFSGDGTRLVAGTGRTVFVFGCRPCGSLSTLQEVARRRRDGTERVALRAFPRPASGLRDYRFRRVVVVAGQTTEAAPLPGPEQTVVAQTESGQSATPAPSSAGDPSGGGAGGGGSGISGGGGGGGGGEPEPVPTATVQAAPTVAPTPAVPTPTADPKSEAVGGDGDGVG